MINKLFIILLLLLSVAMAQFSTNSINGFGNNSHIISPSSESMGGMWMYNSNINNWDPLLASSIYKTDLTMIAVSSSFEGINTNYYEVNNHLINSVNFSLFELFINLLILPLASSTDSIVIFVFIFLFA